MSLSPNHVFTRHWVDCEEVLLVLKGKLEKASYYFNREFCPTKGMQVCMWKFEQQLKYEKERKKLLTKVKRGLLSTKTSKANTH